MAEFGSAKEAYLASNLALSKLSIQSKRWIEYKEKIGVEEYWEKMVDKGISVVILGDKEYPINLSKVKLPPYVLFVRGKWDNTKPCIGMVGTRKATSYGLSVVNDLVIGLVNAGVTIVSGLALGIDRAAHATTLDNGGETIAVLGSGVDLITPASNLRLGEQIVKHGALVSEYGVGVAPQIGHFPARNRIVAGMCLGVVVVEGEKDSGSLITARLAKKENRLVMAVPGPITSPMSQAPNGLIKAGAIPVTSALDVLEALGLGLNKLTSTSIVEVTDKDQLLIVKVLESESKSIDEIVREVKLEVSLVSSHLMDLELMGVVREVERGKYMKITR